MYMRGEYETSFKLGRGGQGQHLGGSPNSGKDFAFHLKSCGEPLRILSRGWKDQIWRVTWNGCQERKPRTPYSLLDSPRRYECFCE